jgi:hypothetical protein
MAINRYRLTSKVTLPSGTFSHDDISSGTPSVTPGVGAPANFGTGSYAQGVGVYGSGAGTVAGSTTWLAGMELLLDPTGTLYTAIGAGNLVQITAVDDVGHSGLSN